MKTEKAYLIGAVSFDPETGVLTDPKGKKATLRPQTAQVLGVLASAARQVVTKDTLMTRVWRDTHVTDDSLVQCISEIRRALGPRAARLLLTVPRQGYRLDAVPGAPTEVATESGKFTGSWLRPARLAVAMALIAGLVIVVGIVFQFALGGKPPGDRTSIAVLPFANLNDDPEQDYLSVGIAEDLLIDLSRSSGVTVLSRSATFGYRDDVGNAAARLHQELGATHLVDGSLQRDGDRIRISVQLVDATTGNSVWAERYDRQINSLFDLQDEVRKQLLDALSVEFQLTSDPRAGTANVAAYDLLLQGRYLEASETRANVLRAIDFYKRAIDLDPTYSDAYARLSNMYEISSRSGWSVSEEGDRALALEMAERAVRLDPRSPFARWTKGRVVARLDNSDSALDVAVAEFMEAIRIDPEYADAFAFLAFVYVGNGNLEEARRNIETAFEINQDPPSWYFRNRGVISYFESRHHDAIEDLKIASEMNSLANASRIWLAVALASAGEKGDAAWELEESFASGVLNSISKFLEWNANLIRAPEFVSTLTSGLRAAGMAE